MPVEPLHSECPHCRAKLKVDPISGDVVSCEAPPDDFEKASHEAEKGGRVRRQDAFESALKAEKSRGKDLDDLFKKAAGKQKDLEPKKKSDNPMDERWR